MKKQILKIYLKTNLLMLISGLIIFFIYSFIICNQAKDTFFKNAEIKKEQILKDIKNTTENIIISVDNYKNISFGDLAFLIQSKSDRNTYIEITDSKGNNFSTENNCYPAYFNQKAVVRFKDFKNQVNDKDYKEIISYLEKKPVGNKQTKYILSCSRYTVLSSGKIIPTELQILETDTDRVWYVQNEIVKTYKLNSDITKYTTSIDFPSMDISVSDENSNKLPLEFVKGNYNSFDDIKAVRNTIVKEKNSEKNKYFLGYFEYAYNSEDALSFSNIKAGDNNFRDYCMTSVIYTESFNTLEYCFNDLLKTFWFIIILFAVTGFLISFTSSKTLKKQYEYEEKRKQLTNSLTHDLKTPLFIIRGYAENLRDNICTEKREHYVERIINQADKMNEQFQTMLRFDKLQTTITPRKTDFDLSQVLTDIISNYQPGPVTEIRKNIIINADKEMMEHLITNLIENAYQHTTDKESIKITLTANKFTVSNKTKNIKKADLKKIWDAYYTMDNSRKNRNGLGLSIVKNIAEQHKFTCISKLDGDTITFGINF